MRFIYLQLQYMSSLLVKNVRRRTTKALKQATKGSERCDQPRVCCVPAISTRILFCRGRVPSDLGLLKEDPTY